MTPAAPPVSSEPTQADRIRELAGLRDEGLLTDEEFAKAERRLLGLL
jgi:hypothetical protein